VTIVAYRPVQEVEDLLGGQRITEVQLVDGNVETHLNYNGQPRKFTEEPWQVFGALRVEGATLAGAELRGNRLAGDGVDYGVEDGGRPDVVHETEAWVPEGLTARGPRHVHQSTSSPNALHCRRPASADDGDGSGPAHALARVVCRQSSGRPGVSFPAARPCGRPSGR
jgi:hypothetical protein